MNTPTAPHPSCRRQGGAATIVIVMLLMFILLAAILGMLIMSGSSAVDATKNEEQIAALSLAESGSEASLGVLKDAAGSGTYTAITCTNFASQAPSNLGRGSFSYPSAADGGSDPACPANADNCCALTVTGRIPIAPATTFSSRTIRTLLSIRTITGIEGFASQFTLNINSKKPGAAVFTNLAYRAKMGGGSSASVGNCVNNGGTCSIPNSGWDLVRTGTNNVSGMGVYSDVPNPGTYTITDYLVDNSNNPTPRNFVQVGAMFYPMTGQSVSFIGEYATGTGSNKTAGTSQVSSSLPGNWNCAAASGSAAFSNAANADTLLYGFSSYPTSAGNVANGVSFGQNSSHTTINGNVYFLNQQMYMRDRLLLVGTQGDNLYSELWYTYNPAFISLTGATNGANFTGTIGATFTGSVTAAGATLNVTSIASGILTPGDHITGIPQCSPAADSNPYCTLGTLKSANTYNFNATGNKNGSNALTGFSNILNLVSNTSAGTVLTLGDSITSSGGGTTYGTLGGLTSGTANQANSTYSLLPVTVFQQVNSSAMESVGTTITKTGSVTAPSSGTIVAVSSGTGLFDLANVVGSVSGSTLTVSNIINGALNIGDALVGQNIVVGTVITAFGTGTGGVGTYTINKSYTAANAPIVARAAVVNVTSASSYTVSRRPTIRLSNNAQLCGGVCALLFDNTGNNTEFNINNLLAGDDWASGFACLKGVDPTQITALGTVNVTRNSWSEAIQ